jgi:Protein of unknown function (DUF1376)
LAATGLNTKRSTPSHAPLYEGVAVNWYKRFPTDFLEGVALLTLEEIGAYAVLLDTLYARGGTIPDNHQALSAVSVRRKRKPSEFHSEVTRERIRAGVIIDRFQKHFMGELDLTPTQIRVGEVLLRKVIPDLTHTDLSTTSTRRYVVEVPPQLSDEEWERKYSLPAPALNSMQ